MNAGASTIQVANVNINNQALKPVLSFKFGP